MENSFKVIHKSQNCLNGCILDFAPFLVKTMGMTIGITFNTLKFWVFWRLLKMKFKNCDHHTGES